MKLNFKIQTGVFFAVVLSLGFLEGYDYLSDNALLRGLIAIVYVVAFQPLVYGMIRKGVKQHIEQS